MLNPLGGAEMALQRALDVKEHIGLARAIVAGRELGALKQDASLSAVPALEHMMLIVSEAAAHLPEDWRFAYGREVDWNGVIALGDIIQFEYYDCLDRTWAVYEHDLAPLEAAVDRMIAAHDPTSSRSPSS